MQRRIGDRVDLPDAFRLLFDQRMDTLDISVAHGLPYVPLVYRRTVLPINGCFDSLDYRAVSALPQFIRPISVNVLMVLRRNLEGHRVGSRFEQKAHEFFVPAPRREAERRP